MGGVFIVFLSLLQVYLCWQAYRVLGIYFICICSHKGRYLPYVVLLLCSGDDLHSLEGSGSGGDQNRNAIGRTTSRPGARRVLQTFYVPLESFNCVQRPASASASIRECVAVSQKCSIRAGTVYHHVSFSCHCHEGSSFLTLTSSRSCIPVSSCRTSLYRSTARPLQRPRNRMLA